jgi:hypothetical protein
MKGARKEKQGGGAVLGAKSLEPVRLIMLVPFASIKLPAFQFPHVHPAVVATSPPPIAYDRPMQSIPTAMQALSGVNPTVRFAVGGILVILLFGAGVNAARFGSAADGFDGQPGLAANMLDKGSGIAGFTHGSGGDDLKMGQAHGAGER